MLLIVVLVVVLLGTVVKRLRDHRALSWHVLLMMAVAGASPVYVAQAVLFPGEPVGSADVLKQGDEVTLDVPPGHSLMITAVLSEESEDPNSEKTAYHMAIEGPGWQTAAAGTLKRATAKGGPDIDTLGGQGVTEGGRRRSSELGENVQDRAELPGAGATKVRVTNWQGTAAARLVLEVVPAPPPGWAVWAVVALVVLHGLVLELRDGAERATSEVAFLSLWAVFLRDGVTPLDDFQRIGLALAPAGLLGFGGVALVQYLAVKFSPSAAPKAPVAPGAAAPGAAAPGAAAPGAAAPAADEGKGRRGGAAARRRSQGGDGDGA